MTNYGTRDWHDWNDVAARQGSLAFMKNQKRQEIDSPLEEANPCQYNGFEQVKLIWISHPNLRE